MIQTVVITVHLLEIRCIDRNLKHSFRKRAQLNSYMIVLNIKSRRTAISKYQNQYQNIEYQKVLTDRNIKISKAISKYWISKILNIKISKSISKYWISKADGPQHLKRESAEFYRTKARARSSWRSQRCGSTGGSRRLSRLARQGESRFDQILAFKSIYNILNWARRERKHCSCINCQSFF